MIRGCNAKKSPLVLTPMEYGTRNQHVCCVFVAVVNDVVYAFVWFGFMFVFRIFSLLSLVVRVHTCVRGRVCLVLFQVILQQN